MCFRRRFVYNPNENFSLLLVISILLNFVRMFKQAHDENRKLVENERKKAEEAGQENSRNLPSKKQSVIAKINTQLGGLAELAMTLKHKKLA